MLYVKVPASQRTFIRTSTRGPSGVVKFFCCTVPTVLFEVYHCAQGVTQSPATPVHHCYSNTCKLPVVWDVANRQQRFVFQLESVRSGWCLTKRHPSVFLLCCIPQTSVTGAGHGRVQTWSNISSSEKIDDSGPIFLITRQALSLLFCFVLCKVWLLAPPSFSVQAESRISLAIRVPPCCAMSCTY